MKLKQIWTFGCKNKKAFIFTMDVAVALVVVFSLLFTASFFVVKKTGDPFTDIQNLRIGSDVIRAMDYKGVFYDPSEAEITSFLESNLPEQYGIQITGSSSPACYFEVGESPPTTGRISSGKEFYSVDEDYCSMRYKIWLK
jgi:hypothetical protein